MKYALPDVVKTVLLETEGMGLVCSFDKISGVPADTITQLEAAYNFQYYFDIFSIKVLVSSSVKGLIVVLVTGPSLDPTLAGGVA